MQLVAMISGSDKADLSRTNAYESLALDDCIARGESPVVLGGAWVNTAARREAMLWWVEAAVKVVVYDDLPVTIEIDQAIMDEAYESGIVVERRKIPNWSSAQEVKQVKIPSGMDVLVHIEANDGKSAEKAINFLASFGVDAEIRFDGATGFMTYQFTFPTKHETHSVVSDLSWYVIRSSGSGAWDIQRATDFEEWHTTAYRGQMLGRGSGSVTASGGGWSIPAPTPPSPIIWV